MSATTVWGVSMTDQDRADAIENPTHGDIWQRDQRRRVSDFWDGYVTYQTREAPTTWYQVALAEWRDWCATATLLRRGA